MAFTAEELAQFTGTTGYYRHWTKSLLLTDGAKFVNDNGAAWLIDAITSYQTSPKINRNQMLSQIQFWKLSVNEDKSAQLVCERDTDDVATKQEIPYTDFPLSEIRFYVVTEDEHRVLMLPSEY